MVEDDVNGRANNMEAIPDGDRNGVFVVRHPEMSCTRVSHTQSADEARGGLRRWLPSMNALPTSLRWKKV